ncbi:MAG: TonB family protein [Sphingomonas sp.]|uniref:energy transducer TonB n=1 Tax=Sphingomonas sp. TaxID=28214 RepID=UPI001ACAD94A|nr:energy transducer TonB [Sphingomonas sp.]MBN8808803.1 TonB family protein [Sphingomonas sp.]
MYADRYATGPTIKPGSMALALAATALPLVAMVVGLQIKQGIRIDKPVTTIDVRQPPPPPPDPIQPKPQPRTQQPPTEKVFVPTPIQLPSDNKTATTLDPPKLPPTENPPVVGTGSAPAVEPVKLAPVLVGAEVDPRYAGLLQPPYPSEEQRAGRSGRVTLRVLIGTDGRVHQVERVSATTDAFFAAAQRQALAKWRFRPATRDGVAIEQWKTMSLRFELQDE